MGTQRKTMNAEAGLHQTLNAMTQESWPSQFSELWRNEFLLFISSSVCAVQFRQPKWPKLMGFSNLTPFEICLCSWESFSEEQILAIRLRADNELSCNYSKEIHLYVSQKPSEDQALPKGEIALLRRSNYWQIFEKGALIRSRLTSQCHSHPTEETDAFLARVLGRCDREKGVCVLSFLISYASQTHSYVYTHFPLWVCEHLGKFWSVSLGNLLGKWAVWRKRDCLLLLIGIWEQTCLSVGGYVLNQCQNSSFSVIVCCGICVWMEKESVRGAGRE